MSSANISSGPANCMKFNSSFLFYIGFFVLLVIGYMWGKRNGTKEERVRDSKADAKKIAEAKKLIAAKKLSGVVGSDDSSEPEVKPVKAKATSTKAKEAVARAGSKAGSKLKDAGSKLKDAIKKRT